MEADKINFQIEVNRVSFVLEEAIQKLEILSQLPFLIADEGKYLDKFLPYNQIEFILSLVENYFIKDNENLSTCSSITNVLEKNFYLTDKIILYNEETIKAYTSQMIDFLYNNSLLRKELTEIQQERRIPTLVKFIKEVQKFKEAAVKMVGVTSAEQIEHEKNLQRAYTLNMKTKQIISDMEDDLEKKREQLEEKLNEKQEILDSYKEKLEIARKQFDYNLKNTAYLSEEKMMIASEVSEAKQRELAIESKEAVSRYEEFLNENLTEEKALRIKRLKVKTQLSNWLESYDTDIGVKQKEYEVLKKEYDDAKELMEELEESYHKQDQEYVVLMQEKEEEDRLRYEEMAYVFLCNRSARRIQRYWRAYRERKLLAKKKRKKKKDQGKGSAKKEKDHGKGSAKKEKSPKPQKHEKTKKVHPVVTRQDDANVALDKKFDEDIIGDIQVEDAFKQKDVEVDLESNN